MENFSGQNLGQVNNNQPTLKQSRRIPSWVGFIIIVVVALILFGGVFTYQYYYAGNYGSPNNQTAAWKTYSGYGISFEYPSTWTYQAFNCNLEGVAFCPVKNGATGCGQTCGMDSPTSPVYFYVSPTIKKDNLQLRDNNYTDIYNQMLSTFGFVTPADQTADWKMYKADGFEIKYPADWSIDNSNGLKIFCDYPKRDNKPCSGLENVGIGAPGPGITVNCPETQNLQQYIEDYNKNGEAFGSKITKQEDFKMGDLTGTKMTGTTAIGVDLNIFFITRYNGACTVDFFSGIADSIHNKIFSTFKFN